MSSASRIRPSDRVGNALIRIPLVAHYVLILAWAGLIFFLSDQPRLPGPSGTWSSVLSVAGHFFVYFVLSLLTATALRRSGIARIRAAIMAITIAGFYGISDEWHQSFVPGRHPSVFDIAVDITGAVSAVPFALRSRLGSDNTETLHEQ